MGMPYVHDNYYGWILQLDYIDIEGVNNYSFHVHVVPFSNMARTGRMKVSGDLV